MYLIGIEINDMASVPALAGAKDGATTSHAGYTSLREVWLAMRLNYQSHQ